MNDDQRVLTIILIVAVLCLVWGVARTWPSVPVWLIGAGITATLALAVVAGVL